MAKISGTRPSSVTTPKAPRAARATPKGPAKGEKPTAGWGTANKPAAPKPAAGVTGTEFGRE